MAFCLERDLEKIMYNTETCHTMDPRVCSGFANCECYTCSWYGGGTQIQIYDAIIPYPDAAGSRRPSEPNIIDEYDPNDIQIQDGQYFLTFVRTCGVAEVEELQNVLAENKPHDDVPAKDEGHIGMRALVAQPLRLPLVIGTIMAALGSCDRFCALNGVFQQPLDSLEVFSGVATIVQGFQELGYNSVGYDKKYEARQHDINFSEGFLCLFRMLRRVKFGGLCNFGIPYSTWTSTNLGTFQRSINRPQGQEGYRSVRRANVQCNRMVVLLVYCTYWAIRWLVEQPLSSLIGHMPRVKQFLNSVKHLHFNLRLGHDGAPILKPIKLWGSEYWMSLLQITEPIDAAKRPEMREAFIEVTHQWIDDNGSPHWCGGPALKSTEAYPIEFGRTIANLWMEHSTQPIVNIDLFGPYDANDMWEDARLYEVFEYVRNLGQSD